MKLIKSTLFTVIFSIIFYPCLLFANTSLKVENIFLDIDKNYKYHYELQTLYDKGIIQPDSDYKLNPGKLLNRDEFVAIAVETSCNECIMPDTSLDLINKYKIPPFFDVGIDNKYFYCISYAKENNFVLGYDIGDSCDDGTRKDSNSPFCTKNNIKLEEALAVVMRMGGIMDITQANKILSGIENGQKYPDLSLDVTPFNIDGSINSFYPYFKKALEYEVVDYDLLGNKNIYKLLEKKGDYLRPDILITKQDFLKMAFVAFKANSCLTKSDNQLAVNINIFNQSCDISSLEKGSCFLSDFTQNNKIFDFYGEVGGICEKGIDENTGYIWRFVNKETGDQIIRYGKFIDNYSFIDSGEYKVFLRIIDNCGNSGEVYNELSFGNDSSNLKVSINAKPILGSGPLEVDFSSIVNGGNGPYEYIWDFGDSNSGNGSIEKHIFIEEGVYEVNLTVIDNDGKISNANVLIKVFDNVCSKDSDSDGINDCLDMCPLISGDDQNNGCPIFIKQQYFYDPPNCLDESKSGYIFANVICTSCPCNNKVDFRATIRGCDIIFPAITSPLELDIYSRGKLFQILK